MQIIFFQLDGAGFAFQNNLKDLDPSHKIFRIVLEGNILCIITEEIQEEYVYRYCYTYAVKCFLMMQFICSF